MAATEIVINGALFNDTENGNEIVVDGFVLQEATAAAPAGGEEATLMMTGVGS